MKVNRSANYIDAITNRSGTTSKIGLIDIADLRIDPNDEMRALAVHHNDPSYDYDYCLYGYIVGARQIANYKKAKTNEDPITWIKRRYHPETSE